LRLSIFPGSWCVKPGIIYYLNELLRPNRLPMKFICLVLLCCNCLYCKAQTPGAAASSIKTPDSVLTKVEFESSFPGGDAGWRRFLTDNLVYPRKAIKKNVQGTVLVRFIVDKDGTLSNIEAMDGPELLREAAVDIIRKSPNWKPAQQYGRKVKSYKIQPIAFRIQ
jgi:TonB family protein